jgi:hypothetical protein
MAEKKSWTEFLMRLPEQYFGVVSVFKKSSKNLPFILSLKWQPISVKSVYRCIKSTDSILEAFKQKCSSHDQGPLKR